MFWEIFGPQHTLKMKSFHKPFQCEICWKSVEKLAYRFVVHSNKWSRRKSGNLELDPIISFQEVWSGALGDFLLLNYYLKCEIKISVSIHYFLDHVVYIYWDTVCTQVYVSFSWSTWLQCIYDLEESDMNVFEYFRYLFEIFSPLYQRFATYCSIIEHNSHDIM